ncbi:hypothetical protein Tco_0185342 [Tanacetum coccineum]
MKLAPFNDAGLFNVNVITGIRAFWSDAYDSLFRQSVSAAIEESSFDNPRERKRQTCFCRQPGIDVSVVTGTAVGSDVGHDNLRQSCSVDKQSSSRSGHGRGKKYVIDTDLRSHNIDTKTSETEGYENAPGTDSGQEWREHRLEQVPCTVSHKFRFIRVLCIEDDTIKAKEAFSSVVLSAIVFGKFCKELEAQFWCEGTQLIGIQLLQLELRLGKIHSMSFRPVKSAEIFW